MAELTIHSTACVYLLTSISSHLLAVLGRRYYAESNITSEEIFEASGAQCVV